MRIAALALLLLATACKKRPPPDPGVIDVMYPLRSFLHEADFIAEGRIEAVDAAERAVVIRLGTVHKGVPERLFASTSAARASRRGNPTRFCGTPSPGLRS